MTSWKWEELFKLTEPQFDGVSAYGFIEPTAEDAEWITTETGDKYKFEEADVLKE
jgi:hypothetical protein